MPGLSLKTEDRQGPILVLSQNKVNLEHSEFTHALVRNRTRNLSFKFYPFPLSWEQQRTTNHISKRQLRRAQIT